MDINGLNTDYTNYVKQSSAAAKMDRCLLYTSDAADEQ